MTSLPHILVIDDEPQILRALRTILTEKEFKVTTARNGEEGLMLAATGLPDIIILDLGLPDMDGVEVCARLREWSEAPIIVLSVRDSERDKVAALDKGADDYLTKPFGIEELLARVRVALRHSAQKLGSTVNLVVAGELQIDLAWHIVKLKGEEIKLSAHDYN
jgi:two-component system KDP operon response regulator KdpE